MMFSRETRFSFSFLFILIFLLSFSQEGFSQQKEAYKAGKRIYKLLNKPDAGKLFGELVTMYRSLGYDVYFGLQYKTHPYDEPLSRYLHDQELVTFPDLVNKQQTDSLWAFWAKEFTASMWDPAVRFPSLKDRMQLGNFMALMVIAHEIGHSIEKRYNVELAHDACFELTPNYFAVATINRLAAYPPMAELKNRFLQLLNDFYSHLIRERLEIPPGVDLLDWCGGAVFKKFKHLSIDVPFYISAVVAQWITLLQENDLPTLEQWHKVFIEKRESDYFKTYTKPGISAEVITLKQGSGFYGTLIPGRRSFELDYDGDKVACFSGITPRGNCFRLEVDDQLDFGEGSVVHKVAYRLLKELNGADSLVFEWEKTQQVPLPGQVGNEVFAFYDLVSAGKIIKPSIKDVVFTDDNLYILSLHANDHYRGYIFEKYSFAGGGYHIDEKAFSTAQMVPAGELPDDLLNVRLTNGPAVALILTFVPKSKGIKTYYLLTPLDDKLSQNTRSDPILILPDDKDIEPEYFTMDQQGNLFFYNAEAFQVMTVMDQKAVYLAGSRRGVKDGKGREAAFAEVRGMAVSGDERLIIIDGMPGIYDQYYTRELKLYR